MTEPYHGQPTAALENDHLRLDYLTENGPRIVRLVPKSLGLNLLAEMPEATLPSPHGPYHLYGGHRLWHAPEAANRTYVPDDGNLKVQIVQDGVRLSRAEPLTGITTEILVKLHPTEPDVQLYHRLHNTGLWPVTLAPWAITQVRIEGVAVLPQNTATTDPDGLLPNRLVALWPYTRWADPRLKLGEGVIRIEAEPVPQPFKIGYFNHAGWIEYHYRGLVFRKSFTPQPGEPHPDFGCNTEVYANDRNMELETLGPLVTVEPGRHVEHFERWELLGPA
jgi:hypothetical protein